MSDSDSLAVRIPEGLKAFLGIAPPSPQAAATSWRVDLSRPGVFRPKGVEPNPTPSRPPVATERKAVRPAAPACEPGVRRTTGRLDQLLKHSERQLNKKLGLAVALEPEESGVAEQVSHLP